MNEALLALGVVVALAGLGGLVLLPWEPLLHGGLVASAIGLGAGVPLAVVYHVQLYRGLRACGGVPRGWIWNPIALHDQLTPAWRRRVVPWAWAGGAGFVVVVLGLVLLGAALASGWFRP
jgi:hypothetical protein